MSLTVKIRGDATQFEKTMRGVNRTISGIGSKVVGLGATALAAAGAYATLGTAFEQLKTASSKAADLESLTIQMATLTGSTKTAKDMIALFIKEEQKSALNTQDYADAAKTMLAFGVSQKGLIPYMRALADVSLGNSERFKSLALAFAQTTAAGRLMGQEVLQFVNAGFNPLQQISLRTGESMAQLKKRMEDGGVSVREVKQAFIDATSIGGKFYKAIENGASSMQAKLAQAKGAVTQLQVAFGTGMNEGIKSALDATTNLLPQFKEKFTAAGEQVGSAITEAVNGDLQRFSDIGELIGDVILQSMKAVMITGMDNLGQMLGEAIAFSAENYSIASQFSPDLGKKIGGAIRSATTSQTSLGAEIDRVSPAIQESMRMFQLKNEAGRYSGFSENMSDELKRAIRDGMIEAERYYSRGSKFSN